MTWTLQNELSWHHPILLFESVSHLDLPNQFLKALNPTFGDDTSTSIESAAMSGSRAQPCLGTERPNCNTHAKELFQAAANNGNLEVLQWGQGSGHELETMFKKGDIADVAWEGHMEIVKYLRQLGISWDEDTCAHAAVSGYLELLKWARLKKCPWNEDTCSLTALNEHLELLKWARANQCP